MINLQTQLMPTRLLLFALAFAVVVSVRTQEPGRAFEDPKQAVETLRVALKNSDLSQLEEIFGPAVNKLINEDPVEATNEFATFAAAIEKANSLLPQGTNKLTLQYGSGNEHFPVPLVRLRDKWYFDTAAGEEEVINRRIGRNELTVLEIIRTFVQAQREYAAADRDSDQVLEYAQKFRSEPGQKNGLFWEPEVDGSRSPLGPFVAEAEASGYSKQTGVARRAFHGYHFKILARQGKSAPGGNYDYIINGNMIGGFAMVAWPSEYDKTGIMTFIVSHHGVVFQKDLGRETQELAENLDTYEPNDGWQPSPN